MRQKNNVLKLYRDFMKTCTRMLYSSDSNDWSYGLKIHMISIMLDVVCDITRT